MTTVTSKHSGGLRMGVPVATPVSAGDVALAVGALCGFGNRDDEARELSEIVDGAHVSFTGSGRTALFAVLAAMKRLRPRDEVIIPGFVCPSVARAAVKAGLRVVLCDVQSNGFGLDLESLERLLNRNTLAVVATHLYGYPVDVAPVLQQAQSVGAFVIEDAAQAFGARMAGRPVGLAGDAGVFSFGMSKVLGGLGAGLAISRDPMIAEYTSREVAAFPDQPLTRQLAAVIKLAAVGTLVRSHHLGPIAGIWATSLRGRGDADDFVATKASRAQVSVAHRHISRFPEITAMRKTNAQRLATGLAGIPGICLPKPHSDADPVFLRLPVIVEDPEIKVQLVRALKSKGINVSEMYDQANYGLVQSLVDEPANLPVTDYLVSRMINLPTHAYMQDREIQETIATFRSSARPVRMRQSEAFV